VAVLHQRRRHQRPGSSTTPAPANLPSSPTPDADHFVGGLLPYSPSPATSGTATGTQLTTGGTYQADQAGRAQAWPQLLDFLRTLPH